jgi:hypothetical protein
LATTATPFDVETTFSTPGTLSASAESILPSLDPNAGGRAMTAVRRPAKCTSMPNSALPEIFSGESSLLVGLPMIVHAEASFSFTDAEGVSFIASVATAPKVSFSFPLEMTPFSTLHAAGATFSFAAAARTSMSFAIAPTVR